MVDEGTVEVGFEHVHLFSIWPIRGPRKKEPIHGGFVMTCCIIQKFTSRSTFSGRGGSCRIAKSAVPWHPGLRNL